ncbi:MAG: VanZ family protein [Bacilli bacterium]|nr:VanZ family protein [Bacilli bacterium]
MKKVNLFFVIFFALLSLFIIGEACVPGKASGEQSIGLAQIFYSGKKITDPTSITIKGPDEIVEDQKTTYTAEVLPANCTNKNVVWNISDPSVAEIDGLGNLTALASGKVTLKATSVVNAQIEATKKITVKRDTLTELKVQLSKESVVQGETCYLTCFPNLPLSQDEFTYLSSDDTIAKVDKYGYIKTLKMGEVTFSVSCPSYSSSITTQVTLKVTEGVFNKPTNIRYEGQKKIYNQDAGVFEPVFDSATDDINYFCTCSDNSYIDLNPHGNYSAKKSGTVKITIASYVDSSIAVSFDLTIAPVIITSLEIATEKVPAYQATSLALTLVSYPLNRIPDNTVFTFTSSDETVASFNGMFLTGYKDGKVTVTVTWTGDDKISASKELTIDNNGKLNFADFQLLFRKLIGHFALFMVTGIFGFLSFSFVFLPEKKDWVIGLSCLLYGFFLALTSELIQYFVPGRYMTWEDIGTDFAGFAFSTLLMWLIFYFIRRKKAKKESAK